MEKQSDITETIRLLEERLLKSSVRRSASDLSELLADDFVEYGRSGRALTRQQVIEGLRLESSVQLTMSDFEVKTLAHGVILATYCATRHEPNGIQSVSLRSSIWKLIDGRWQIIFHQGTPTSTKLLSST